MDELSIVYSPEVRAGLERGTPLVALESTVIAHGLPYPQNLETAHACEAAVREAGAVPATLAVFAGRIHLGCTPEQLQHLATGAGIQKLSIRDLPVALARRQDGATTVATSVYLAGLAGVDADLAVFATGGIGGVHRGWAQSLDISADLPVLAQTALVVVCAGAKSILDLPATREWLETAGVTVVGWQTDEFPAFYSRTSGLPVDVRVDSAAEVAALLRARRALGLPGAILVTVPVPEAVALPTAEVERAIAQALDRAAAQGVQGKALTPFLLGAVVAATQGRGLIANQALLVQNAGVAGRIAVALHDDHHG